MFHVLNYADIKKDRQKIVGEDEREADYHILTMHSMAYLAIDYMAFIEFESMLSKA